MATARRAEMGLISKRLAGRRLEVQEKSKPFTQTFLQKD